MSVSHDLRVGVLGLARRTGVMRLVARSGWRSQRLLILCYHGCSQLDEHEWNPRLYMSPQALRRRFELIKARGYNVVPLDEGLRALHDGTLPKRAVVLTFDDGAVDFKSRVVPLLEEFGFHATLYVSTYYVDKQLPVFDTMLSYLLWKARGRTYTASGLAHLDYELDLRTDASRARTIQSIQERVLRAEVSADGKEALLSQLAAALKIDYAAVRAHRLLQFMTREELASLPSAFVSLQLHTHRHRVPVDEQAFKREIDDNRAVLLAARPDVGPLVHFCYPSGHTHPLIPGFLRAAGVKSATTCAVALATASADPMLLPRYVDSCAFGDVEFEGWLSGVSQWLPRRSTTYVHPDQR